MQKRIWVFWTGDNEIPQIRKKNIESMKNKSGAEITLVTSDNLSEYIAVEKIHPAYNFLNLAHRADYLRCYFMHHFGGGYCDIKEIHSSWDASFRNVSINRNIFGVGYQEVNRHGVANVYQSCVQLKYLENVNCKSAYIKWRWMQLRHRSLIGNGAFIFKPQTKFTDLWWKQLNFRLDLILPYLEKYPASQPKERYGQIFNGVKSQYPVPWTWILGDIIHPLSLKFNHRLMRDLPAPSFLNYQ